MTPMRTRMIKGTSTPNRMGIQVGPSEYRDWMEKRSHHKRIETKQDCAVMWHIILPEKVTQISLWLQAQIEKLHDGLPLSLVEVVWLVGSAGVVSLCVLVVTTVVVGGSGVNMNLGTWHWKISNPKWSKLEVVSAFCVKTNERQMLVFCCCLPSGQAQWLECLTDCTPQERVCQLKMKPKVKHSKQQALLYICCAFSMKIQPKQNHDSTHWCLFKGAKSPFSYEGCLAAGALHFQHVEFEPPEKWEWPQEK